MEANNHVSQCQSKWLIADERGCTPHGVAQAELLVLAREKKLPARLTPAANFSPSPFHSRRRCRWRHQPAVGLKVVFN